MGVAIDCIKVGKCYVTALGQIRRVLEISGGRVKYEARGTGIACSWSSCTDGSHRS